MSYNNMSISTLGPVLDSERRRGKWNKKEVSRRPRLTVSRTEPLRVRLLEFRGVQGPEDAAGLSILGAVLPAQVQQDQNWRGEKLLMAAVLKDAIKVYTERKSLYPSRPIYGYRIFNEAREWFLSPEEEWPFSFLNICAVLGLDAEGVRRQVLAGLVKFPKYRERER